MIAETNAESIKYLYGFFCPQLHYFCVCVLVPIKMADSSVHTADKSLKLDDSYLLVAAIDIGTTSTGYAFSFKETPTNIIMNKNWLSSVSSAKTSTVVLTNPDGSFNRFGYEAEDEYLGHEPEEGYQLYRCFKMVLYNLQVCYNITIRGLRSLLDIKAFSKLILQW